MALHDNTHNTHSTGGTNADTGGGNAFSRIQALLQRLQQPQGLQQAAMQLAQQQIAVPNIDEIKAAFPATPNPNQQALNRAAPQAAFNGGQLPGQAQPFANPGNPTNPLGMAQAQIPSPILNRQPVLPQQAQAFSPQLPPQVGGRPNGRARF